MASLPQFRYHWRILLLDEKRFEGYCLPKGKAERKQYAEVIGTDGFHLLSAIYSETAPSWLREVPMVQVLRQVWVQQYYAPDGPVAWRTEEDLPPSALQIHSPYDAEARFSTKREILWAGYKVHLTETCDNDTLISSPMSKQRLRLPTMGQ